MSLNVDISKNVHVHLVQIEENINFVKFKNTLLDNIVYHIGMYFWEHEECFSSGGGEKITPILLTYWAKVH